MGADGHFCYFAARENGRYGTPKEPGKEDRTIDFWFHNLMMTLQEYMCSDECAYDFSGTVFVPESCRCEPRCFPTTVADGDGDATCKQTAYRPDECFCTIFNERRDTRCKSHRGCCNAYAAGEQTAGDPPQDMRCNAIYVYFPDAGETEDNAKILFSAAQLRFVRYIYTFYEEFCGSNRCIPDYVEHFFISMKDLNYAQETTDIDFDSDFDSILKTTHLIDDAIESGCMWFYWDTNSMHSTSPFYHRNEEMDELFDKCMQCPTSSETFKELFQTKEQFFTFLTTWLPDEPETIQVWT